VKTKIFIILISFVFAGMSFSCEAVSEVVKVAGDIGIIDKKTVNSTVRAINASSKSIDSAVEEITPEQEYYIGRAVAANILATYKIYIKNRKLTNYLNNICAAITINSPFQKSVFKGYHVALLDSNDINAFATSGGHIYISRGLVNAAKSEDALAGVIAHEVAHIQLQHSIKAIKSSRFSQAVSATTSAVGAVTGMDMNELTSLFNESVGEIVQTLSTNGYSQAQEFDADNTAMLLMSKAGYNPAGLLEMLRALSKVQKPGVGLGKTHPTPAQRMSNAELGLLLYTGVSDTSPTRRARFASALK
jgi:beta-barrel assembly-enhancing protease